MTFQAGPANLEALFVLRNRGAVRKVLGRLAMTGRIFLLIIGPSRRNDLRGSLWILEEDDFRGFDWTAASLATSGLGPEKIGGRVNLLARTSV